MPYLYSSTTVVSWRWPTPVLIPTNLSSSLPTRNRPISTESTPFLARYALTVPFLPRAPSCLLPHLICLDRIAHDAHDCDWSYFPYSLCPPITPTSSFPYPSYSIIFNLFQVIDGAESTLDTMERVPVNPKNRPLNEIRLTHVSPSSLPCIFPSPSLLSFPPHSATPQGGTKDNNPVGSIPAT